MSVFDQPPTPPKRDKQVVVRMSVAEKKRLDAEAERRGISVAELIRIAVNALVGARRPKKKK